MTTRKKRIDNMGNADVKWKYAAIVVGIIALAEFGVLYWLFDTGYKSLKNEELCTQTCAAQWNAASYGYDTYTETCACYGNDRNIVLTKDMARN